jgi:hypothetical protein
MSSANPTKFFRRRKTIILATLSHSPSFKLSILRDMLSKSPDFRFANGEFVTPEQLKLIQKNALKSSRFSEFFGGTNFSFPFDPMAIFSLRRIQNGDQTLIQDLNLICLYSYVAFIGKYEETAQLSGIHELLITLIELGTQELSHLNELALTDILSLLIGNLTPPIFEEICPSIGQFCKLHKFSTAESGQTFFSLLPAFLNSAIRLIPYEDLSLTQQCNFDEHFGRSRDF